MKPGFYPSQLPKEILNDPNRDAEIRTFEALKSGMPPDYHIFYSCDWLDTRSTPVPSRDGECDFIVAHEDLGILFIEVKGGELGRDGHTGKWFRKTINGKKNIKDPVKQARTSKHVTLQLMREHWPKGHIPYLRLRHGVVLPHSFRPKTVEYLGAHLPLSMFAFAEDMESLASKILVMLLEKEGEIENKFSKPGPIAIKLLHKFFTSSFEFTPTLSSVLDVYDKRISGHTNEQRKILEFTSIQKRALILGGAGTGKTFLAHAKAQEFGEKGLKTLLLYYNSPITREARRNLRNVPNLFVKTFHELCRDAAKACGDEYGLPNTAELYEEKLPQSLEKALSEEKAQLFDAIIIDEAQDLKETWLESALLCLKELDRSHIFVFADDNQNLYKTSHNLSKILECNPLTLTKNVRNTDKIFSFSKNFYSGITNSSYEFDGPQIRYEALDNNFPGKGLLKLLVKLKEFDGIPWKDIAVLSMNSREKSKVYQDIFALSVEAGDEQIDNKFIFDSVWRFKGLENKVAVIIDIDGNAENPALQYVAASRARTLLIYCGPKEYSSRFESLIGHS